MTRGGRQYPRVCVPPVVLTTDTPKLSSVSVLLSSKNIVEKLQLEKNNNQYSYLDN